MKVLWQRWLVLLLYGSSALALPRSPVVGLSELSSRQSTESRRASYILLSRFRRWLENQEGGISVRELSGAVDPSLKTLEQSRQELARELDEGKGSSAGGLGKGDGRVTQLRVALELNLGAGPTVASALGLESVTAWLSGNFALSESLWDAAVRWSPTGEISRSPSPESIPPGWQKMANRVVSTLKRDCLLSLPGLGRGETINGFAVTPTAELAVATGRAYLVGWRDETDRYHASKVFCASPGRLAVGTGATLPSDLSVLAGGNLVDSLVLLEAAGGRFRLYLYSQGVGLDEIPLDGELSVAKVLARPLADELPIDAAAFRRLKQSHGLVSAGVLVAGPWLGSEKEEESVQTVVPRWYNSWTTWAVAGAVLTGVLVACLASRPEQVQTQAHGGLSFRVE